MQSRSNSKFIWRKKSKKIYFSPGFVFLKKNQQKSKTVAYCSTTRLQTKTRTVQRLQTSTDVNALASFSCPFCHDPTASPSSHWKYPSQDVPRVSFVWLTFHSVSFVLVALFYTKRRCQDPTRHGFIWLAFVLTKFHINWSPTSSATASTARCLLVLSLWVAHSLSVLDNMTFVIASILVAWRNSSVVLAWM